MNKERIAELFSDFNSALGRLKEALSEDISKGSIIIDGTIKRFEFTFELAWKLAKAVMEHGGKELSVTYPRMIIKEAYSSGIIKDGETWLAMLDDRNKTSHIYDEKQALKIYSQVKDSYYALLEDFSRQISKVIDS